MYDFSDRQKSIILLLVGLFIGSTATFLGTNTNLNDQKVSQELVSTLENQTGQNLELINTKEESGVYRVDIRDSEGQLNTYHVTKDGKFFSQNMVEIQQVKAAVSAREDFSSCLEEKNVVLYGNSTQRSTVLQIRAMGGAQTVTDIFRDVNDPENLQEAASRGVRRVPALYYNQSTLQGVNSMESVTEFTGCEYSLE